jgi:carbamoylphosphate synthase small subunit
VSAPAAILALADGSLFSGVTIGATGLSAGEVVFNTAMTGYQEILSDPSYCKQLVTLTTPHIGNVGANSEDNESRAVFASGLIIRDLPVLASNFRSEQSLSDYLRAQNVVAIAGIDTRRLTRILREQGAQAGAIMAGEVTYTFSTMPPAVSQSKAGKIYGLAVTSGKRVSAAPDVPTLKESGVKPEVLLNSGLMGPKGLPPAIVERLGAEVKKALASPEMKLTLANAGAEDLHSTPAEFAALMKVEAEKMAKAVQLAGVVLD